MCWRNSLNSLMPKTLIGATFVEYVLRSPCNAWVSIRLRDPRQTESHACSLHCTIHRQALASKTLPQAILVTPNTVIKTVNFVKTSAFSSRLFKKLCQDMDSLHETLQFASIRRLSKGDVVRRVFALREEIKLFLGLQNKMDLLSTWTENDWELRLAYLVGILGQLNSLTVELPRERKLDHRF